MGAVRSMMSLTTVAVHGLIQLLKYRKLITGILFTNLELMGSAKLGFGERIAVVATGGNADRHGLVDLVYSNLPQKIDKVLTASQYEFVLIKNNQA